MLLRNLVAGLTLAAITIPEQMATAKLGGFEPQIGLYAFVGASVGFAVAGANRILTVGADSTITPIFAATLTTLAASSVAPQPAGAVTLALLVAGMLIVGGVLRLGWIADLLSTPIVTGFLAGIALHIAMSQLPDLLGVEPRAGTIFDQVAGIAAGLARTNPWSVALGAGVLALALLTERLNPRLPGALIGVALATAAVVALGLEGRGVAVLGVLPSGLPVFVLPSWQFDSLRELVPLAMIISLVVMMQTATVSRSFAEPGTAVAGEGVNVNRDFIGVGVANLGAALLGSFPVDASPPRTGVVRAAGGTSQLGVLAAAVLVALLALGGGGLLRHVPQSALAGVLLFVAIRIVRGGVIAAVARQAPAEFALIVLTALAVVALPIPTGVAIGIGLSLGHGVWITTHTRVIEFRNMPGTTVWWPSDGDQRGEVRPGLLVLGFTAPLLFANAETFRQGMTAAIAARDSSSSAPSSSAPSSGRPLSLVVLEGVGIADIDYTAAQALRDVIEACRQRDIAFAIARLESTRARQALQRFDVLALLGTDRLFLSVAEAVSKMMPDAVA
jgi:MFS superfamily sulfate permease-like transporter